MEVESQDQIRWVCRRLVYKGVSELSNGLLWVISLKIENWENTRKYWGVFRFQIKILGGFLPLNVRGPMIRNNQKLGFKIEDQVQS